MSRLTLSTVCVFLLLCGAASVDVKTRQKRDGRIQTQGLLNSVDIDLAAAADRSRFRAGNTLTADKAHEKISAEAKGDFSFSFRETKNVVTDKVNHGQGNPFVLMDQEFVENLVKSDDKIGGVLDTVAGVFGKQHGPMYQFLGEMLQLKLNGYRHVMNSKAKATSQGRIIKEWPGENTHSFIDYDQVVKRLKEVPQAQRDGTITRDNSLGLLRLANWLWPDQGPNNAILLGATVKDHEFYRPYLDYTVGNGAKKNWNYDDLLKTAKEHLKATRERPDDIQGSSFHVFNDVKLWTTKVLFKAHLGATGTFFKDETPTGGIISDEEAQEFIGKQAKLVMLIVFPDPLMTSPLPRAAAGISDLIDYRNKMVDRIEVIIESNKELYPDPPRDPTLGMQRKWTKCHGTPKAKHCGEDLGNDWKAATPSTENAGNKKKDDCWWSRRKIACQRPSPLPAGKRFSDGQRRLLASSIFDSLVFAGGLSVPSIISAAMGALYKKGSGITLQGGTAAERSKKIKQLVGEATRQYPGVVGFPVVPTKKANGNDILGKPVKDYLGHAQQNVYDADTHTPNLKQHLQYRTAFVLAAALRDTKVWGDDEAVFTLRDPKLYDDHLDVAWAFPATVPAKAPNMPHLSTCL
eukprot:g5591.t1